MKINLNNWNRGLFIGLVMMCNIGCDQTSKTLVRTHVDAHESISLIEDHVILTKVENSGAFLSVGDDLPPTFKYVFLIILPIAALIGMLGWLFFQKNQHAAFLLAMSSIIGGGIGNLFDRLVYGSVTDFLYIDLGFAHTGVFNMADVSITAGVIFLLIYQLFPLRSTEKLTQ
ncbi:MAG: signal peptidase II [Saprospiraceae bacterium]|nr:signal peptidase II [Saprospiraceae bacterium]